MSPSGVPTDNADITILFEETTRSQSTCIVLIGKAGSGKSSLATCIVDQDVFPSNDGWESYTKEMNPSRIEASGKNGTSATIVDTRGMMGESGAKLDDKTAQLIDKIITNDANGVIIVCITMFDRFDSATLETLAFLHEKFGDTFWSRVVVTMTKADNFIVNDWLTMKKPAGCKKSNNRFLVEQFTREIEQRKASLKKYMTSHEKFGMSENDFDKLLIPVIPTSRFGDEASTKKMVRVEYGFWFDQLIVYCCQRERGGGVLQIHAKRLAVLPRKVFKQFLELKLDGIEGRSLGFFEECSAELRRAKNCTLRDLGYIFEAKWIWRSYCHQHNWPRFEPAMSEKAATASIYQ